MTSPLSGECPETLAESLWPSIRAVVMGFLVSALCDSSFGFCRAVVVSGPLWLASTHALDGKVPFPWRSCWTCALLKFFPHKWGLVAPGCLSWLLATSHESVRMQQGAFLIGVLQARPHSLSSLPVERSSLFYAKRLSFTASAACCTHLLPGLAWQPLCPEYLK